MSEQRKIGPFILDSELGRGGMGTVWLATYVKTGQKVALKELADSFSGDHKVAKRFEREMEILQKLRHPNIVRYYGGVSTGTQQFYAMELVTGGTVDDQIRKKKQLSWQEAIDYGIQLAKALEHAHNHNVVHRDLKPGNLLLNEKGVLKLSDFGVARDADATQLTQAGKTLGTMAYMAPEQITGKSPITRKTDLYAFGCVMFQMLAGRTPFESKSQSELLFKHLDEAPPSVRDFNIGCPLILDEFIDELLEKDPDDRPHDALAVQTRLAEIREQIVAGEDKLAKKAMRVETPVKDKTATIPILNRLFSRAPKTEESGNAEGATTVSKKKKGKKGKKASQEADVPFWERTWFLALCMVVFVGVVSLALLPKSAAKLAAEIAPVMASNDPAQWLNVETAIESLLKRYPDTPEGKQAAEWKDQIDTYKEERKIENRIRRGLAPESEAERLYVSALQYEKFGDRASALEKFESMQTLLEDNKTNRPFLNLSRRQIQKIKETAGSSSDRATFVNEQIAKGDEEYLKGDTFAAKDRWRSIVELYRNNEELKPFVNRASDRIFDPDEAIKKDREAMK